MNIDIDEKSLKHGVLGLVVALVEIIRDALKLQAVRRMEGGSLTEKEIERLGEALMELDIAIEKIKEEQGIVEAVKSVRDGLDSLVDDVLDTIINPDRLSKKGSPKGRSPFGINRFPSPFKGEGKQGGEVLRQPPEKWREKAEMRV